MKRFVLLASSGNTLHLNFAPKLEMFNMQAKMSNITLVSLLVIVCHLILCSAQETSTESLDAYICLRTNGFFPHDVRCDHFYECRNATIINEGICKQGLRFDYRYRKKPRCIASDQIDCRITQVVETIVSNVYNRGENRDKLSTRSPEVRNNSMTTITTTARPRVEPTTLISPDLLESTLEADTSTTTRPPNRLKASRKKSATVPTTSLTTARTQRPVFPPPPPTTTTTTTTTTTASTSTTTLSPTSSTSKVSNREDIGRHHHHHPARSHHDRHGNDDDLHRANRLDFSPSDESGEDLELPARRRKVVKKPMKLRRGRLQEQSSLSGDNNVIEAARQRAATGHHHSLLSRTIDSEFTSEAPVPETRGPVTLPIVAGRPQSIHCSHPSGYYSDKEDCRKFYACDDGRAFPMWCPLGLAYDEATGTCAWPDMVEGCKSEEMLRFTCPEANENEILDYGDPRYPTNDCRKFVVCVVSEMHGSRTPRLLGCEEGLVFNPESRTCDYPENVPSCANYYGSDNFHSGASHRHHHHHRHQKRRARL